LIQKSTLLMHEHETLGYAQFKFTSKIIIHNTLATVYTKDHKIKQKKKYSMFISFKIKLPQLCMIPIVTCFQTHLHIIKLQTNTHFYNMIHDEIISKNPN